MNEYIKPVNVCIFTFFNSSGHSSSSSSRKRPAPPTPPARTAASAPSAPKLLLRTPTANPAAWSGAGSCVPSIEELAPPLREQLRPHLPTTQGKSFLNPAALAFVRLWARVKGRNNDTFASQARECHQAAVAAGVWSADYVPRKCRQKFVVYLAEKIGSLLDDEEEVME